MMDAEGFGATVREVEERIRQDFADDQVEAVRQELRRVEENPLVTLPAPRIQMAVLILADGDWPRLRHFVREAQVDYRDVLAPAFYPDR